MTNLQKVYQLTFLYSEQVKEIKEELRSTIQKEQLSLVPNSESIPNARKRITALYNQFMESTKEFDNG